MRNIESINQLPYEVYIVFLSLCMILAFWCAMEAVKQRKDFVNTLRNTIIPGLVFSGASAAMSFYYFKPEIAFGFFCISVMALMIFGAFGFFIGMIIFGIKPMLPKNERMG